MDTIATQRITEYQWDKKFPEIVYENENYIVTRDGQNLRLFSPAGIHMGVILPTYHTDYEWAASVPNTYGIVKTYATTHLGFFNDKFLAAQALLDKYPGDHSIKGVTDDMATTSTTKPGDPGYL